VQYILRVIGGDKIVLEIEIVEINISNTIENWQQKIHVKNKKLIVEMIIKEVNYVVTRW
jgi:hypothetical protein